MKWKGLLQPDSHPDEHQGFHLQLNTVAKNPKVVKEVIFIGLFLFNFTISGLCQMMINQVPQPFDKSLVIILLHLFPYGFITPLVILASNKKLRTYTIREFWDVAPMWMVYLKDLYFQIDPPALHCENEDQSNQELRTISQEIDQRVESGLHPSVISVVAEEGIQGKIVENEKDEPHKEDLNKVKSEDANKTRKEYVKESSLIAALKSLDDD